MSVIFSNIMHSKSAVPVLSSLTYLVQSKIDKMLIMYNHGISYVVLLDYAKMTFLKQEGGLCISYLINDLLRFVSYF